MTYRGVVSHGVVVLDGEKPSEGTLVEVTPLAQEAFRGGDLAAHPAIGIWRDRNDLPTDPIDASKLLRQRLMRRADE